MFFFAQVNNLRKGTREISLPTGGGFLINGNEQRAAELLHAQERLAEILN